MWLFWVCLDNVVFGLDVEILGIVNVLFSDYVKVCLVSEVWLVESFWLNSELIVFGDCYRFYWGVCVVGDLSFWGLGWYVVFCLSWVRFGVLFDFVFVFFVYFIGNLWLWCWWEEVVLLIDFYCFYWIFFCYVWGLLILGFLDKMVVK